MNNERIKIWNRTRGNHGFVYHDGTNKTVLISPGSFIFIPIEEVYQTDASTKSFKKGILEIDKQYVELRQELGYDTDNPNALSEEEISKLLTKPGFMSKETKEKLSEIKEKHAQDKLIEVARKLDLPQSKIKFIEQITGRKVFNELIETEE